MLSNVSTTVGPVQRWIGILSFLLTCDVLANVAYIFIPTYKVYLLVLACVTILCCILGLVVLLFLLMETRAFKAGYPGLICLKFSRVFIVDAIYLGLSVALLFILRVEHQKTTFYWSSRYTTIFVLQKIVAVLHIFFTKRSMLHLCQLEIYDTKK